MDQFDQVFALLVGVVVIFGPLAAGLTKLVDMARNAFDKDNTAPKWTWNVLALVLGLAVCLAFEINVMAEVLALIPRFSDGSALDGVVGQIITGAGMAGMAAYHHETMDRKSAEAKALQASVPVNSQT